jgi:hypothetical protein
MFTLAFVFTNTHGPVPFCSIMFYSVFYSVFILAFVFTNTHGPRYMSQNSTATSDRACFPVRPACLNTTEYQQATPTITSNRVCTPYGGPCTAQQYVTPPAPLVHCSAVRDPTAPLMHCSAVRNPTRTPRALLSST